MSIDRRIQEELERRDAELGDLSTTDSGLFGAMYRVFTGGWRRWAAFAMLITLALTAVTFWSGYQFFTADDLEQRVFWGLIAVASANGVGLLKLWFFLEMNLERDRNWTARELKRLQIELGPDRADRAY